MSLDICEIFCSLQGESTYAGLACVFVRLSGCNLDCAWCDTPYAREEAVSMSLDEIMGQVASFNCRLVEITGGEPLIQAQTPELVSRLVKKGYTVLMETNGSQSIHGVDPACIRILDVKCPSSQEAGSFLENNLAHLTPEDEIKFVVGSKTDFNYACGFIKSRLAGHSPAKIHLSPVFGAVSPKELAAWILADRPGARLALQQHKFIWPPEKRGV